MKSPFVYLIAALLFALLLGFIDEGYYNFNFLRNIGNILVLMVYLLIFWAAQLLTDRVIAHLAPSVAITARHTLAVVLGLGLPIMLIMLSFSRTNLD